MIYEILDDFGNVINTIVADQAFVEAKYPGRYRDTGRDERPPAPVLQPIITKIAMITRFTDIEYTGILAAAKTDVEVQGWLDRFYAANQINLADSRTVSGINMMVTKGLLTQTRANEILNNPVQDDERP